MSVSSGPPADLLRVLDRAGAGISDSRKIDHGTQHRIVRGAEKVNLNLYDSGKALVQGKESGLKGLLDAWKQERIPSKSKKSPAGDSTKNGSRKSAPGGQRAAEVSGVSRVGTDEAGKGDYFGPLVVAGVRVFDEAAEAALRDIGVRDSKLLGTAQAVSMAKRIMEALGPENVSVVSLEPPEFERRRSKAGDNVNRLLGEVNVEILTGLSAGVEGFVVDEFAKKARSYIETGVPSGVELEVRPRAEDDAAVAAASVVARARYLEEMDELSRWAGFALPRGSTHVKGAAHRIYSERGRQGLERVAKISFSITNSIGAV